MDSVRQEIPQRYNTDEGAAGIYNIEQQAIMGYGLPPPEILRECCELFEQATSQRMKYELENNAFLFQYGPAIGTTEFRESLASFLAEGYHSEVNKSDLVQTSGATSGLHLILSTLVDLAGVVFVDEYTYMIALTAISQFSTMKIVSVPLKDDGPDTDRLEELVQQHRFAPSGKLFWGVYYTIPTFHNPTGIVFSEDKCQRLITLARNSDILIACDDVYNLLHYANPEQAPPKRLFAYDIEGLGKIDGWRGNVISNGTFSKILSPGIRLGWMECPPRCVEAFRQSGVLQSGGAANNYMGGVVSTMIQQGMAQKQLKLYSTKYAERLQAMLETLDAKLPKECTFSRPEGGYFVWIRFPEHIDCAEMNKYSMEKYRVSAVPGTRFSVTGEARNFMRLTFAFHSADYLRKSVATFCEAARGYMQIVSSS
ncbi:2-aminoadipate transaminase isoform X1 [Anopheles darlingi]|uniref:2-aminoadipate transaminase isoform X1 n=1 Tax=Anopheles darlingi TaxID=43151 RepID=UPI00210000E7|nr:2-aminoadipate transaminase isoform X1 [Anopheles darlingi]